MPRTALTYIPASLHRLNEGGSGCGAKIYPPLNPDLDFLKAVPVRGVCLGHVLVPIMWSRGMPKGVLCLYINNR